MSFADWAAWYNSAGKPYIKPSWQLDIDDYLIETNLSDNDDNKQEKGNKQKNKNKSKARIIWSVCLKKEVDSESITVN